MESLINVMPVKTGIQYVIVLAGFRPGFRRGDDAGMTKPGLIRDSFIWNCWTPDNAFGVSGVTIFSISELRNFR